MTTTSSESSKRSAALLIQDNNHAVQTQPVFLDCAFNGPLSVVLCLFRTTSQLLPFMTKLLRSRNYFLNTSFDSDIAHCSLREFEVSTIHFSLEPLQRSLIRDTVLYNISDSHILELTRIWLMGIIKIYRSSGWALVNGISTDGSSWGIWARDSQRYWVRSSLGWLAMAPIGHDEVAARVLAARLILVVWRLERWSLCFSGGQRVYAVVNLLLNRMVVPFQMLKAKPWQALLVKVVYSTTHLMRIPLQIDKISCARSQLNAWAKNVTLTGLLVSVEALQLYGSAEMIGNHQLPFVEVPLCWDQGLGLQTLSHLQRAAYHGSWWWNNSLSYRSLLEYVCFTARELGVDNAIAGLLVTASCLVVSAVVFNSLIFEWLKWSNR